MSFSASAPGSLMLLGEYAVLAGKHALVCALNQRMHVTITPRKDDKIYLLSENYGEYQTKLSKLSIEPPFQFILAVLIHYQPRMKTGFDLFIRAEFSDQLGFGSSAAVTVASLAAVTTWLGLHFAPLDLVREGRKIVKRVQGMGSGADIAASVYGGMVHFQMQPLFAEKLPHLFPLVAIYSGSKLKTVEAVKRVYQQFEAHPVLLNMLYQAIGQCAVEGVQAVLQNKMALLGAMMTKQQGLMEALGVSTPGIRAIIEELRAHSTILGAKISGSGFGDCVIGLGDLTKINLMKEQGQLYLPIQMTQQGVHCEKN